MVRNLWVNQLGGKEQNKLDNGMKCRRAEVVVATAIVGLGVGVGGEEVGGGEEA